jgi:hypothetical protein
MTAVHEVVNRLVTLADTALPTWQVLDGWNGKTDLARETLVVAFAPTPGTEAVTSTVDLEDGSMCDYLETVAVACTGAVWDGDMAFTAKRGELVAMLATLRGALADDRKLGGIAYDVYLAPSARWYADVKPKTKDSPAKATVQVDFAITARVYAE